MRKVGDSPVEFGTVNVLAFRAGPSCWSGCGGPVQRLPQNAEKRHAVRAIESPIELDSAILLRLSGAFRSLPASGSINGKAPACASVVRGASPSEARAMRSKFECVNFKYQLQL